MNTPEEIEAHAWLVFCPPNRDECDYRIYWDKEHAEIMDEDYRDCDDDADHRTQGVHDLILRSDHDKAIADAVAAERAKFAAFCDEKGEPRKVLGTLPVTADGCFYAHHSRYDPPVYGITRDGKIVEASVRAFPTDDNTFRPNECYSTREAALAAQEARE